MIIIAADTIDTTDMIGSVVSGVACYSRMNRESTKFIGPVRVDEGVCLFNFDIDLPRQVILNGIP